MVCLTLGVGGQALSMRYWRPDVYIFLCLILGIKSWALRAERWVLSVGAWALIRLKSTKIAVTAQYTSWDNFCWKLPCCCYLVKNCFSGIGICSSPLDQENNFFKKNKINNQISMLSFLLYIKLLFTLYRAVFYLTQSRFLLKSKTFK